MLASLAGIGLGAGTLLELAAPLCLFSQRFRPWFASAMGLFHVGIFVMMDVAFWGNLCLLVVFFDLDRVARWLLPARQLAGLADEESAVT